MALIDCIEDLFKRHGRKRCAGENAESVSALEHALQCAHLAELANASPSLIAAALLHDIGHFIDAPQTVDGVDDAHELRAVPFLTLGFGIDVVQPIRLHVQAKRYLVATDARYAARLSPASLSTLSAQGGLMDADDCRWFERLPFAQQALGLRYWDDAAKQAGAITPPLSYYMPLLGELTRSTPTAC